MGRAVGLGRNTADELDPMAHGCPGGYGGAVRVQRPIQHLRVAASLTLVLE
jgi:hypothetical protein